MRSLISIDESGDPEANVTEEERAALRAGLARLKPTKGIDPQLVVDALNRGVLLNRDPNYVPAHPIGKSQETMD